VQITQSAAVEPNQTTVLLIAASLREPSSNDPILKLHAFYMGILYDLRSLACLDLFIRVLIGTPSGIDDFGGGS